MAGGVSALSCKSTSVQRMTTQGRIIDLALTLRPDVAIARPQVEERSEFDRGPSAFDGLLLCRSLLGEILHRCCLKCARCGLPESGIN